MASKKPRPADIDPATSVKKPRFSLPDPAEMIKSSARSRSMTKCCKDFATIDLISLSRSQLDQFKPATILGWLVVKYGLEIIGLIKVVQKLPASLTRQQRLQEIKLQFSGITGDELQLQALLQFVEENCEEAAARIVSDDAETNQVFAPPSGQCLECDRQLTSYHSCKVKTFNCMGAEMATKYTLRCQPCGLLYNYDQYGTKQGGFHYYPTMRSFVEATDSVLVSKRLLELQCNLA